MLVNIHFQKYQQIFLELNSKDRIKVQEKKGKVAVLFVLPSTKCEIIGTFMP